MSNTTKANWLTRLWLRIVAFFRDDDVPPPPAPVTPHVEVTSPNVVIESGKPDLAGIQMLSRYDIANMSEAERRRHRKRLFNLHQSRHLLNRS